MKIYEIGTGYTPIPAQISAATEIIIEDLSHAFLKQGIDVSVIDIKAVNRVKTDLDIIEVPVFKCFCGTDVSLGIMHKLKRVIYSVNLALKIKKILKAAEEKVVLHFHNQYNMFFFLMLVSKKIREKCITAYTNHNGIWRMNWKDAEPIIKKRYFQETVALKKADMIFALNKETKDNIINYLKVDDSKISVLYNGVNVEKYCPFSAEEISAAKQSFNIQDKIMILQVGSVCENKGQLRSLELLLPLLKTHKNLIFGYAGGIIEEEYQTKIHEFAVKNGISEKVKYFGMVNPAKDLPTLYNLAAATIFPSVYEAFGLVTIESLSCAVPVFCDENAVFRFGDGCIYYSKENFVEIFKEALFNDKNLKTLKESARKNAVENYSWEKVSSDYLNFINV